MSALDGREPVAPASGSEAQAPEPTPSDGRRDGPWNNWGFGAPGDKVVFLNRNGYDYQLARAQSLFRDGQELTLKSVNVEDFYSDYEFEEVSGIFNTVMFALAGSSAPSPEPATAEKKEGN